MGTTVPDRYFMKRSRLVRSMRVFPVDMNSSMKDWCISAMN